MIGQPAAEPRIEEGSTTNVFIANTVQYYMKEVIIMKQIIVDNISTTYYITEDGKCYNSITNKFLKGQENKQNHYFSYNLTLPNGKKKRCYAHRLVATAFIPNPTGKPEVNHKDGNKLNNCVDNLEWVTSQENKQHALFNSLYKYEHVFCFSKDKKLVAEYLSIQDAARSTKISPSIISQEIHKVPKTLSGGFYWSDKKELGEVKNYSNLGKAKPVNQYDKNGKFIMTYPSTGIAAKAVGGVSSHVGECCRGKIKNYKGFIWKYVEDIVLTSDESQSASQKQ